MRRLETVLPWEHSDLNDRSRGIWNLMAVIIAMPITPFAACVVIKEICCDAGLLYEDNSLRSEMNARPRARARAHVFSREMTPFRNARFAEIACSPRARDFPCAKVSRMDGPCLLKIRDVREREGRFVRCDFRRLASRRNAASSTNWLGPWIAMLHAYECAMQFID